MAENKETNWLPWVIAAVAIGVLFWKQNEQAPAPDPKPVPSNIESDTKSVLPALRTEQTRIFTEAAQKVEAGEIKTDKDLYDYLKPALEAARKASVKNFDVSLEMSLPRNEDGTFAGHEVEAAKLLRRIAKSW